MKNDTYEDGMTPLEAAFSLMPKEIYQDFEDEIKRRKDSINEKMSGIDPSKSSGLDIFPDLMKLFVDNRRVCNQRIIFLRELQQKLKAGEWVGYGFKEPRQEHDKRRKIPRDIWGGKIAWDISGLEGAGEKYKQIRVFQSHSPSKGKDVAKCLFVPKPKERGRPSMRDLSREAYQACKQVHDLPIALTREQEGKVLKEWVSKTYPWLADEYARIQDKSIRRHVEDLRGETPDKNRTKTKLFD
ncbi:MAG TPA: hypothetical protein DCW68_05185 [Rhodospirillaceae bacterium]|nr:MAG: hypothetical protein A2018_02465 [Alphaproteobacteria bacterium GWF2_58_20]HAU29490.1 hypothetical protein [Rhodospirillaceae bacterium]